MFTTTPAFQCRPKQRRRGNTVGENPEGWIVAGSAAAGRDLVVSRPAGHRCGAHAGLAGEVREGAAVHRVLLVEPFLGDGLRPTCSASRSQDDVVLAGERGDHTDADACCLGDVADGQPFVEVETPQFRRGKLCPGRCADVACRPGLAGGDGFWRWMLGEEILDRIVACAEEVGCLRDGHVRPTDEVVQGGDADSVGVGSW